MRHCYKLACGLVALIMVFALSAPVALGQGLNQDKQAAQDQDAGAGIQTMEPNAPTSGSQDIAGGGMEGPDYVLGPEDVVTITVFNLPEMTQTVRVENDGTITVKLLGKVQAAGLTTSELRDELQRDWGKSYLEDPHVQIFIRQFHSQPVSVVGAVAKPGIYQLPGPRSLIQVLAMAGGVNTPQGSGANGGTTSASSGGAPAGRWVYITRKTNFGTLHPMTGLEVISHNQIKVDLGKLLYSDDTALNVPIEPFDVVTVSKAGIVYVVGDVKRPGGFTLEDRDSLTALQALALALGFDTSPNKRHDEIIHQLPDGTRKVSFINLGKIMKGKAKDPLLTADDILVVPGNGLKTFGATGIGTALATVSGLIIWRGL